MAVVKIGSARIDERGKISGGCAGDQTGCEVSTQNWYKHSKGWIVLRAKDDNVREKIALAMERICSNNNIGYNQRNRNGLYKNVKDKGFDPAKCTVKTDCDCSAAIRVCMHFAGITCCDFNTASQKSVLCSTGRFDVLTESKYVNSSDYLHRGDILLTKTKGHTVVVLNNGSKAVVATKSTKKPVVAAYTLKKGSKGVQVKYLQEDLNYLMNAGLEVDGDFGNKTLEAVKNFQSKYGLEVDGSYGPKSNAKMKTLI